MPRRSILSTAERDSLLALPDCLDELIQHYSFSETDLAIIRLHRRPENRLGFAVQLCYMRYPGLMLSLHDRILGRLFNAAKNKHHQQFQASAKSINHKLRLYGRIGKVLLDAKQNCSDPFAAIESVISWDDFATSVTEAQKLAQPADFDFLHHLGKSYSTLRRYAPKLLDVLKLRATPAAQGVLDAIEVLRNINTNNIRKLPADAPITFIKPRWAKLVLSDRGIDWRYYELCAQTELKNALRSGDIWVESGASRLRSDVLPIHKNGTADKRKQ